MQNSPNEAVDDLSQTLDRELTVDELNLQEITIRCYEHKFNLLISAHLGEFTIEQNGVELLKTEPEKVTFIISGPGGEHFASRLSLNEGETFDATTERAWWRNCENRSILTNEFKERFIRQGHEFTLCLHFNSLTRPALDHLLPVKVHFPESIRHQFPDFLSMPSHEWTAVTHSLGTTELRRSIWFDGVR